MGEKRLKNKAVPIKVDLSLNPKLRKMESLFLKKEDKEKRSDIFAQ